MGLHVAISPGDYPGDYPVMFLLKTKFTRFRSQGVSYNTHYIEHQLSLWRIPKKGGGLVDLKTLVFVKQKKTGI